MIIKQATLNELNQVSALFNDYRIFYEQPTDLKSATSFIKARIQNNESVIFYAQNAQGEYLGFVQLYPSFSSVSMQRTWILNDLYVAKSARKQGVAKQLMAQAKHHAINTHAKGIALQTAVTNHHAQALYQSLGYKKGSTFDHYFLAL